MDIGGIDVVQVDRRVRKGRSIAWVALNPRTRAGSCQVVVRLRDGSGQHVIVQRRIVLGG